MAISAVQLMQTDGDRMLGDAGGIACAVAQGVDLLSHGPPKTFKEMLASKDKEKWQAAMDAEMSACAAMNVWDYVRREDLPKNANVLPCKWVWAEKTDEHGHIIRHKARLTPKGFRQKEGVDFFEVFAATGMYKTMRVGLSLTAKWDHELDQLDVPTAFLNADLEEDVYMEVPEGYREGKEGLVCKLNKSLYGLRQGPRNWYLLIRSFVIETLGFKPTVSDPCLFIKRSRTGRLMMLFLFVDDFQASYQREDTAEWNECKALLVGRFKTKDMGKSTWILGMRIQRDRAARTITLDQELYVTKALEKYGLAECKVAPTPKVTGDAAADSALDAPLKPAERQLYMEKVGTIMYGSIATRLETAYAAHSLARKMQAPTRRDMLAADRVMRYWAGTKDLGLIFGSRNGAIVGDSRGHRTEYQVDVCGFADADWANGKDRKSISGWVSKLNGDPVAWASKTQAVVATSTCEAELYAESEAIKELLWLRGLMKELGLRVQLGSIVHGDNQGTIAISKNGVKNGRTKHIDVRYHFITDVLERGDVQLKWVPTTEQQADIFTKALATPVFEQFRKQLMTR